MSVVKSQRDIIEMPITQEMLEYAEKNAHQGSMNDYSMLAGERNVEGLLGELAVKKYFPVLIHEPTKDYDFKFPDYAGDLTIDVKNKFDVKRSAYTPNLDWDCTIFGYEANKKCDIYLFTSTNAEKTKIWLKGIISKQYFVKEENFYRAGSRRSTTQGSVTYKKDNYVIAVKNLNTVKYLKDFLEKSLTSAK